MKIPNELLLLITAFVRPNDLPSWMLTSTNIYRLVINTSYYKIFSPFMRCYTLKIENLRYVPPSAADTAGIIPLYMMRNIKLMENIKNCPKCSEPQDDSLVLKRPWSVAVSPFCLCGTSFKSLLYCCIVSGNLAAVQQFEEPEDSYYHDVYMLSIEYGHTDIMEYIHCYMEDNVDDYKLEDLYSSVVYSTLTDIKKLETIKFLVALDYKIDDHISHDMLGDFCKKGYLECVKYLLSKQTLEPEVDESNLRYLEDRFDDITGLKKLYCLLVFSAIEGAQAQVLDYLLLWCGENIHTMRNIRNHYFVHNVHEYGNRDIAKCLIKHGVDFYDSDHYVIGPAVNYSRNGILDIMYSSAVEAGEREKFILHYHDYLSSWAFTKLYNLLERKYPFMKNLYSFDREEVVSIGYFKYMWKDQKILINFDDHHYFQNFLGFELVYSNDAKNIAKKDPQEDSNMEFEQTNMKKQNDKGYRIIRISQYFINNDTNWKELLEKTITDMIRDPKVYNVYLCANDEYDVFTKNPAFKDMK